MTNSGTTKETVDLHDLVLLDEDGREVRPEEWRGKPVLLVFLRWLG